MHGEKKVFIRDGFGPVLRALHEAGAIEVPKETFRMCDGSLGMELPLRDSDYCVWVIGKRNACSRSHDWQVALRIGDPPSGIHANTLTKIEQTPPGTRKTNFREVIAFSQAPNQSSGAK